MGPNVDINSNLISRVHLLVDIVKTFCDQNSEPPFSLETSSSSPKFKVSLSMANGRREPSIFDNFTLSPLPYPVLLVLFMVLLLLGISWSFTFEDIIESTEEQMNLLLLATVVLLLLLIRCLSFVENFNDFLGLIPYDYRRTRSGYYGEPSEGSSPWGVAAAVVLLLILVSYQSTFQDMWKP